MSESKLNKKIIIKKNLRDKNDDIEFWKNTSYERRLNAIEEIRRDHHGEDYAISQRLQRVFRVVHRKSG